MIINAKKRLTAAQDIDDKEFQAKIQELCNKYGFELPFFYSDPYKKTLSISLNSEDLQGFKPKFIYKNKWQLVELKSPAAKITDMNMVELFMKNFNNVKALFDDLNKLGK